MPTTPRGLLYPDSSGHTRIWEHLQALAESADDTLDAILSLLPIRVAVGKATINISGAASGAVTIAFPVGRFTQAPVFLAFNGGGSGASVFNLLSNTQTDTGVTVTAVHRDAGSTGTATIVVNWIALQFTEDSAAG